ncbi:terminase small subunit [Pseudomonas laurylsulfatiphila]|uniref:terminase small subunit n=1 Tax=Pseudomonas laurylsulfatiphila TaxID=2011015 RepID=UPI00215EC0CC|nr:terminase small subunit [Pseudomonas laurylsulfatiphila]UVM07050.1 terminase small subunit [Pseudomonas laurylsulfatiphila]
MALTEQKRRYAEARLSGQPKKQAAISAGCPEKTASQAASRLEKDPEVLAAMGRAVVVNSAKKPEQPQGEPDPYIPAATDDPMDFLKGVMKDLVADPKLRIDAAKALLPYVHGKVAEGGKKDQKADAARKAATGRFRTGAPPAPLRSVK